MGDVMFGMGDDQILKKSEIEDLLKICDEEHEKNLSKTLDSLRIDHKEGTISGIMHLPSDNIVATAEVLRRLLSTM